VITRQQAKKDNQIVCSACMAWAHLIQVRPDPADERYELREFKCRFCGKTTEQPFPRRRDQK
jgi:hypothetical protein